MNYVSKLYANNKPTCLESTERKLLATTCFEVYITPFPLNLNHAQPSANLFLRKIWSKNRIFVF